MKHYLITAFATLSLAWNAHPQSAPHQSTVLEFSADGRILFIADSDAGRIYAYELPAFLANRFDLGALDHGS